MKNNSQLVAIGKTLHEEKAKRNKNSEIIIDNTRIDKLSRNYIVELKKSDADTEAAIMQIKYYMYILANKGVIKDGKIEIIEKNKETKTIIIPYDNNIQMEIELLISEIEQYLNGKIEPFKSTKKCKKCAYYEYCNI
jgi:CRISPR-associated exonuclease Cas4